MANFDVNSYVHSLPKECTEIIIPVKNITSLPNLNEFTNLLLLNCHNNQLTTLPTLPENLEFFYCSDNQLISLPELHKLHKLKILYCPFNQLTVLPSLFENLQILDCNHNQLTCLPTLPKNLQALYCSYNQLTVLPTLPENLGTLYCSYNQLTVLPTLPDNLRTLYCDNNQLKYLPKLSTDLRALYCNSNQLTHLPTLPEKKIQTLYCSYNQLYFLPILPDKLEFFDCIGNPIYNILQDKDMVDIKRIIKNLNVCRYIFYCIKYKKHFKYWLWELIRQPKIIQKYHPNYLIENMDEDTDLDIVLNSW